MQFSLSDDVDRLHADAKFPTNDILFDSQETRIHSIIEWMGL